MTKQTKAIGRLVDIKEKAVESAEAAYALACRATREAEVASEQASAVWLRVVEEKGDIGMAGDLADRDLRIRALRRAADAAARNAAVVKRAETAASAAVTAAKIEHRRYETWLERKATAHAAEVRRLERLAEDEVSARKRISS